MIEYLGYLLMILINIPYVDTAHFDINVLTIGFVIGMATASTINKIQKF